MGETWLSHSRLLETVERVFAGANQAHGLQHACKVAQLAAEIALEPEFAAVSLDQPVLLAAALLHDSGHTRAVESWSSDRFEHVEESVRIAQEALSFVEPFDTDLDRLRQVCYLILRHDETNYSFPIKPRLGKPAFAGPFQAPLEWPYVLPEEDRSVAPLLAILREADGLAGTGANGAERTLSYSLGRGMPAFAEGNPLNAWMWEESAVGNVRLAAKRALLDASTARGKDSAWQGYLDAERLVREVAEENGVEYEPELHYLKLCGTTGKPPDKHFRIHRFQRGEQLVDTLRRVGLKGDASVHPYGEATIETKLVEISRLSPLAYYALEPQLEAGKRLSQEFLTRYCLDPFDLSGIVEYTLGGTTHLLGPPIVEVYVERQGPLAGQEVWALVDGLHRCVNATRDGYPRIRAVVISGVPEHLPLVPLPLRWRDLETVDSLSAQFKKREYRFSDCDCFPPIHEWSSARAPVTTQDCRYFFYRDLSSVGSSGIRRVGQSNE